MSDELTRLLTETLRGREADVKSIPDLTAHVLQGARAARNRRLALGWGATGVVAVVALAVAVLGPVGQQASRPVPANSGTPSPTAKAPAAVRANPEEDPLLSYASRLPSGPPIALIPRAEKRGAAVDPTSRVVVVTAAHKVTLPADTSFAFWLTSSAEGLLVAAHSNGFTGGGPDPDQSLYLIRPDGSLSKLHKGAFNGLAVDPSGKRYALAEISLGAYDPVNITVASISKPGRTHSRTEPIGTKVLGWTTQGLLLSDTSRTWLWEPGASSRTELPGLSDASVLPTERGQLLVGTRQPGNSVCLHPYTLSSRKMGPILSCGAENGWTVSPDGRRAVVGSTVLDLDSGRVGPSLMEGLGISFVHWEDPTHVLGHVLGAGLQGSVISLWVRCDVTTGGCEQAPIQGSTGTWDMSDG